uniref:Endonuclease V n=1 Tax=Chlamydomonas leiostraca TaxID=1034604 RepID=A0A7S0R7A0_9CHLO|mmetsp:Transcript_15659/g.39031  ORF Transcript_15659/g.39031 Transcript_15659/m.39031 type:complete len:388 (+) Transcript_15659:248-1411(+)
MEAQLQAWDREQQQLAAQVIETDDHDWVLPPPSGPPSLPQPPPKPSKRAAARLGEVGEQAAAPALVAPDGRPLLHLVGGLDISFAPPAASSSAPEAAADGSGEAGTRGAQLAADAHAAVGAAAGREGDEGGGEQGEAGGGHQRSLAALVVMTFPGLDVVYEDYEEVDLTVPYLPGYLAFREVPAYAALLARCARTEGGRWMPQLLLVDGCGVLHPARCGAASHLGVAAGIPTIGVAKNLLVVDGLRKEAVEAAAVRLADTGHEQQPSVSCQEGAAVPAPPDPVPQEAESVLAAARAAGGGALMGALDAAARSGAGGRRALPLVGASGAVWGAAVCGAGSKRPLYVSVGHRVSLATAVEVVARCCVTRAPEPVRQADLRSRARIREWG